MAERYGREVQQRGTAWMTSREVQQRGTAWMTSREVQQEPSMWLQADGGMCDGGRHVTTSSRPSGTKKGPVGAVETSRSKAVMGSWACRPATSCGGLACSNVRVPL